MPATNDSPGFVYVASLSDFYKVGCAIDVRKRLAALATLPLSVRLVHYFPSKNCLQVERFIHRRFADKRVKGEWFRLEDADIEALSSVSRADSVDDLPISLRAGFPKGGVGPGSRKKIKVDADLYECCEAVAARNRRPVAWEIRLMLEDRLSAEGFWPPPEKKESTP